MWPSSSFAQNKVPKCKLSVEEKCPQNWYWAVFWQPGPRVYTAEKFYLEQGLLCQNKIVGKAPVCRSVFLLTVKSSSKRELCNTYFFKRTEFTALRLNEWAGLAAREERSCRRVNSKVSEIGMSSSLFPIWFKMKISLNTIEIFSPSLLLLQIMSVHWSEFQLHAHSPLPYGRLRDKCLYCVKVSENEVDPDREEQCNFCMEISG